MDDKNIAVAKALGVTITKGSYFSVSGYQKDEWRMPNGEVLFGYGALIDFYDDYAAFEKWVAPQLRKHGVYYSYESTGCWYCLSVDRVVIYRGATIMAAGCEALLKLE